MFHSSGNYWTGKGANFCLKKIPIYDKDEWGYCDKLGLKAFYCWNTVKFEYHDIYFRKNKDDTAG